MPLASKPWQHTTRIIGRADAHERIAALKGRTGKESLVFGSRTLWADLLAHGLVDQLHLMVRPVVVGGGTPLFKGQLSGSLCLLETRTWDSSDNVLLRYDVRDNSA